METSSPPVERKLSLPVRVFLTVLLIATLGPIVLLMVTWASFAIYYSNLPWEPVRVGLAWTFFIGTLGAFAFLSRRLRTLYWFLGAFGVVVIWFLLIPASNDRNWMESVAREPHAEIEGNRVRVYDIRTFEYRSETDFTPRYYDKTFDLDKLKQVDFILSSWGVADIVHTMLSFGFEGDDHLAVSIETRREKGEPQEAVRGLFKQYELIYILADENDLFRLRTNFRKPPEKLFVYPTNATPEQARALFLDIIKTANRLHDHPQYYNTLCDNCTTGIVPHLRNIGLQLPFDLRMIVNGFTDQLGLEHGWLSSTLPYKTAADMVKIREAHFVNPYVRAADATAGDYSKRIRAHFTDR